MTVDLEKKLSTLPRNPGVYFHKSASGEIIYVGKAAILRNRVRQYFHSGNNVDAKTAALVKEIVDVDWLETESEIDALFLESEMVKRYMPRYNILLRDDKSQLFVRIDMKSDWPHVAFTRNPKDDGADYFGPFYNGYAVKKALKYLRRVFPYFTNYADKGSNKLYSQIGLEPNKDLGSENYKKSLRQLISYIKGNRSAIVKKLEFDMKQAANEHKYEDAAIIRNKIRNLGELKRRVMFGDQEFLDASKDRALVNLKELLHLEKIPLRVEGFDISHISGSSVVASMVVFTNGVSDRSNYRRFKVEERNDDVRNIEETISRRFSKKNTRLWGIPDLVLIDGGKAQLEAAAQSLVAQELWIPLASIAKRNDELVVSQDWFGRRGVNLQESLLSESGNLSVTKEGDFLFINLHGFSSKSSGHSRNLRGNNMQNSKYNDVLMLIQRIRDESHRFAIGYHTELRSKQMTRSKIDDIPGIGPKTKKRLLNEFGSLKRLLQEDENRISKVVGKDKAKLIIEWNATINNV